jgi:hypothetical protein
VKDFAKLEDVKNFGSESGACIGMKFGKGKHLLVKDDITGDIDSPFINI